MQQASGASNETQLPRAVLRRSAAINDRLQARNARQPDLATPEVPKAPEAAVAADATPPGNPAPAPTPATPSNTPPADPRENDPVYWRHRYKTLEGVLRVERADRKAEREQHDRLRGLGDGLDQQLRRIGLVRRRCHHLEQKAIGVVGCVSPWLRELAIAAQGR